MIMKHTLVFLLLFFSSLTLQAATLKGTITDAQTGDPLANVNMRVQGQKVGVVTDAAGQYIISDLPANTYILHLTHIGYADQEIRIALVQDLQHNLALTPTLLPGDAVTVVATRARKRETPVTFSNITKKELEDRYTVQDMPKLLSELPAVNTYDETGNGIGYSYLTMRGFDQRRIAVMVNGIPQNDPEDHNVYWVNFPDLASSLEDIQVQRGAGSAFYGPAAIGGSINLVTDRFAPEPKLTISSGYGSYDTRKLGVTLNSGLLNDRLALNAHFGKTQTDGYRNLAWVDFLSYFFGGAYYTEHTTTRFHIYGSKNTDHLNFYGISPTTTVGGQTVDVLNDRTRRKENPIISNEEIEDFHQPHYELIHEWTASPNLTVSNSFFYVQGGGYFDFDGSWADDFYFRLTPEFGFTSQGYPGQSLIRAFVNNRHGGWLPRITYQREKSTTEVGVELRYHQSLHYGQIRWAENLPPEVTPDYRYYEYKGSKWMTSAYINHNHKLSDRLNIMGNLQIAHKKYRIFDEKYVGTEFTVPNTFINPKLGLNFNLTNRANIYTSIAHTEREPRLVNYYDAAESTWATPQFEQNANNTFNFDKPLAKPEKLNNIELGFGYTTPRFRANANAFWMDFRDEIVKSGQLDLFGQPVTGNADKTLHSGIELSAAIQPVPALTIQGNTTLSHNTFKNHTDFSSGQAVSRDGNRIAGFPDFIANLRATYEHQGLRTSLYLRHVGKQYTDNSEDNRQNPTLRNAPGYIPLVVDPYTTVDLSLGYDLGRQLGMKKFEIRLNINNLFDTLYETHGEGLSFFPAATRNVFLFTKFEI
jgi:iron complex outermembrane recepter protein